MSALAALRSSCRTDLARYSRSWGLWLLLLAGPVGARFMIARDDGAGVQIAIGGHLPVMTSATLGVSLGIVVSTLLLPVGFIYLRSNTTRRRPWQVEEVAPASRVAIALGRFGADLAVLGGMLATLTFAGWFLGALIVAGPLNPLQIAFTLWLVAAPALAGLAALRLLFDARPLLRRGWGEFLYLVLWTISIIVPIVGAARPSGFAANMLDFPGFMRPLVGPMPSGKGDFSIGSTALKPGRVPVDVMAGVLAPGYVASRLAWGAITVALAAFAGLVHRPHTARKPRRTGAMTRLLSPGPPPAPKPNAPPARASVSPIAGLIAAEFRLIGAGRPFRLLAALAAAAGPAGDYRHVGSPAALLLLAFALSAHAGRSEARGLRALTVAAPLSPWLRRAAFVIAGIGWALLMVLPTATIRASAELLTLALATGAAAALIAAALAAFSGSGVAPRLILLMLWYGYLSS